MDDSKFKRVRTEGHVVECNGMSAVISATHRKEADVSADYWSVGQLLSIHAGNTRVVGVLFKIDSIGGSWSSDDDNELHIHVELVGEVFDNDEGEPVFSSGLSAYPHLGAVCHRIRHDDLAAIFANDDGNVVTVGALSQSRDIPALISIDNMISRHFAVVGTTGVGKSTAVSLIIRKILESRPDIRVLILDPHNEFEHALPQHSLVIDEKTLSLPFWLYTLEEMGAAIFNGRKAVPAEMDLLRELIPVAKQNYKRANESSAVRSKRESQITADTPVPYRMSDLIKLIDERMGMLDSKNERSDLRSLLNRLNGAVNDPRYTFMFGSKSVTDNMVQVLSHIFRIPDDDKPVCILQLAGIPSEVVNSTVSVLCRLAFDLAVWSHSRIKTLVVCEEAHRYIPADQNAGFEPTRASIARVAKEGRKYGVHLGVITQRPSELDPTILSQCNTFFAMRLGNEVDQQIVRKAIPGGAQSFVNFVPSLANREAIAFGQGASTPMRLIFEQVPDQYLPGNAELHEANTVHCAAQTNDLSRAVAMMRHAQPDDLMVPAMETPLPQRGGSGSANIDVEPTPQREASDVSEPAFTPPTSLRTHSPLELAALKVSAPPTRQEVLQAKSKKTDDPIQKAASILSNFGTKRD